MGNTFVQEISCINKVRYVAAKYFQSEFIEFPGRIDNGFDGAIFWRDGNRIVDAIYVQCKGGDSYFPHKTSEHFKVCNLSKKYISTHLPIWRSVAGPAIMVLCNANEEAWWIDLKDDRNYDERKETLFCEFKNLFDFSAKKALDQLIKKKTFSKIIPRLSIEGNSLKGCLGKSSLKEIAHAYYYELSKRKLPSKCPELDKKILFTRVGWRHITRFRRSKDRIAQSLLLLPLIPTIIENISDYEVVARSCSQDKVADNKIIKEKIILLAECSFSYRFPSIIKVVLIRKRDIGEHGQYEKIWFYSIYEANRNRQLSELAEK